jgi:ABC-type Na+ efflux pump permease subunit
MITRVAIAGDLVVLAMCAASARAAFRELFVNVPSVHVARWPGPWSTPEIALLVILTTAIICVAAALLLLLALRSRSTRRAARTVELGALVVMVCAWIILIADFFGNTGQFG